MDCDHEGLISYIVMSCTRIGIKLVYYKNIQTKEKKNSREATIMKSDGGVNSKNIIYKLLYFLSLHFEIS